MCKIPALRISLLQNVVKGVAHSRCSVVENVLSHSLHRCQADRGILAVLSAPKLGDSYHPSLSACSVPVTALGCVAPPAWLS